MAYRQDLPTSLALSSEQPAEVAALIEAAGVDVSEFTWAVRPNSYHLIGPLVSALVHTPTGYSFRFEFLERAPSGRIACQSLRARALQEGDEPLRLGKINWGTSASG